MHLQQPQTKAAPAPLTVSCPTPDSKQCQLLRIQCVLVDLATDSKIKLMCNCVHATCYSIACADQMLLLQ